MRGGAENRESPPVNGPGPVADESGWMLVFRLAPSGKIAHQWVMLGLGVCPIGERADAQPRDVADIRGERRYRGCC